MNEQDKEKLRRLLEPLKKKFPNEPGGILCGGCSEVDRKPLTYKYRGEL